MVKLCDYGCNRKAKHQFKNGKWCCEKVISKCPSIRSKLSKSLTGRPSPLKNKDARNKGKTNIYSKESLKKMSEVKKGKPGYWKNKNQPEKSVRKMRETLTGRTLTKDHKEKISKSLKMKHPLKQTIKQIQKKYPLFSKIEEMRYNPNKPEEKEIQVHCKNHNCRNSKEKGGWFTPTRVQLERRWRALEKPEGFGESNFYCSEECKQQCPLYNLISDPYKKIDKSYTEEEYQTFRKFVLERDNYICQFCGEKATHVHHERPQKLEPFFTLDPDLAWSCCQKCHYKYGHRDECSTGKLATKIC